jgi:hypothetical protein
MIFHDLLENTQTPPKPRYYGNLVLRIPLGWLQDMHVLDIFSGTQILPSPLFSEREMAET